MKQLYFKCFRRQKKTNNNNNGGAGGDLLNTLHCLIYEVINYVQANCALQSDFAAFTI